MKRWRDIVVRPTESIRRTIEVIDAGGVQIAVVTDDTGRLLGTVTDGDVRRAILRGVPLSERVDTIMNRNPKTADSLTPRESLLAVMQERRLRQIPIVSEDGTVRDLVVLQEILEHSKDKENWVVLMAGGTGTRLRPLTDDCPKPLLPIGDKPLLETILENFVRQGFKRFFLSVNYKADMVKDHFGDGSRWGVELNYLHETEQLGTAGCLSLLPERPKSPLVLMNGDLLTKVNFEQLLEFHREQRPTATMCVREYDVQVPYGVVRIENDRVAAVDEKPVHKFFVNAGIYVLEPDVLDFVPTRTRIDMPAVIEQLLQDGRETVVFPIREYWMDIGRLDDLERAKGEFSTIFS